MTTYKLSALSYDFASGNVSVTIQKRETGNVGFISMLLSTDMPQGLDATQIKSFIVEHVKRELAEVVFFEVPEKL